MTSSSTCGLRRRHSINILPSNSPPEMEGCCTSRKISRTDSRLCRTIPKSSTRWRRAIPRSTHEACAGTIQPLGSHGLRASESLSNGTRIIPTLRHENGRKELSAQALQHGSDPLAQGQAMMRLITELYPICRSITGEGLRETLRLVQK